MGLRTLSLVLSPAMSKGILLYLVYYLFPMKFAMHEMSYASIHPNRIIVRFNMHHLT